MARANSRRAIAKPLLTGPLCLFLAGGLLACKPQEPVYDTDVDVGDQGQPLLPTGMYYVYGDELMRGRVRDPDLSHLVPPAPEEEPGDDKAAGIDPEIQALVARHNELMRAKQYDQLTALYKKEFRELAAAGFALSDKFLQIIEKIGSDSPMAGMLKPMFEAASKMKLLSTESPGDDRIIGTLQPAMPGIPAQQMVFERVDDQWLMLGEQGFSEANLDALLEIFNETSTQLDAILAGLEDGSMDQQTAAAQVQRVAMGMGMKLQQIMQNGATTAPPSEDEDQEEAEEGDDGDSQEEEP